MAADEQLEWPEDLWGPETREHELTQKWLDELEESGVHALRRVLSLVAELGFHEVDVEDQVRAVAASQVVAHAFDGRFRGALGERLKRLRHVVVPIFEWDRSTSVEALRRILAEGSHLRAAWEHRREGSWIGHVQVIYDLLRDPGERPKYDPRAHRLELTRLDETAPVHQLLFGLWCLEPSWLQAKSSFESQLSRDQWRDVLALHEALWAQVRTGAPTALSTEDFDAAMDAVEFEDCPQSAMTVADSIKGLAEGRWLAAATSCGLAMIDLIQRYVDAVGLDTPMESSKGREYENAPAIFRELELQRVMVDSLLEGQPLIDVREQRRSAWAVLADGVSM
jgi:hypothetical protein